MLGLQKSHRLLVQVPNNRNVTISQHDTLNVDVGHVSERSTHAAEQAVRSVLCELYQYDLDQLHFLSFQRWKNVM